MSKRTDLEAAIPAVRRYARALSRDAQEVDDLVQDTLLRALSRLERHDGKGDLRPWLLTMLHNLHVSRWRRWRRRRTVSLDEAGTAAARPAPQPQHLEVRDVLRGLDHLPEEQRQVLVLVAVEGLEYATVARVLGVPVGTVMSRLSRGRERLRAFMEDGTRPRSQVPSRPSLRIVR